MSFKRLLCFLAAVILLVLPLTAPAEDGDEGCSHPKRSIYLVGAVAAQPGIPGYSGDAYCGVCKQLVSKGHKTYAEESNGPTTLDDSNPGPDPDAGGIQGETPSSGRTDPASLPRQENQQLPEQPAQEQPDQKQQNQPQPENPVLPEQQAEPDPRKPEMPVQEQPAAAQPSQEVPKQAEDPILPPREPLSLPEADQPSALSADEEQPDMPPVIPDQAEQKEETPAGKEDKPAGTKTSGGGRKPFSKDYPYRRVLMNPDPDAWAEAAGTLIWPKASSPFQKMLKD